MTKIKNYASEDQIVLDVITCIKMKLHVIDV